MDSQRNSIVGVSLGTRSVGIAVFRNGKLREWQLKDFKGAWSKNKRHFIVATIERIVVLYGITAIAIKVPHCSRTSKALNDLMHEIQRMAGKQRLFVSAFSLKELKQHFATASKKALIEMLVTRHPELHGYYVKTLREPKSTNPKSPFEKVFEAVAAASIMQNE